MALVDYTSSDSEPESEARAAAAKRQKTSHTQASPPVGAGAGDGDGDGNEQQQQQQKKKKKKKNSPSALPPLPAAFHDLYASTVRVSTGDDPTLHQGRKRVNPHRVGNWPTHLYIEWHPTPPQRAHLTTLLSELQAAIIPTNRDAPISITSFLTSDLAAPQPLHISLSRPIVLSTAQKDEFLSRLLSSVGGSGVAPFALAPRALSWHRTHESARSFLVLRVGSTAAAADDDEERQKKQRQKKKGEDEAVGPTTTTTTTTTTTVGNGNNDTSDPEAGGRGGRHQQKATGKEALNNPELTALLARSNALVTSFSQPPLYATISSSRQDPSTSTSASISSAFHISLAWTFAEPTAELGRATEEVFSRPAIQDPVLGMRVPVDGVKAKIGNVVTHVPLSEKGKGKAAGTTSGSGSRKVFFLGG